MNDRLNWIQELVLLVERELVTKDEARALLIDGYPQLAKVIAQKADAKA